jgi:hypothetical protein
MLTKPGAGAEGSEKRILGAAVAARTTDRLKARSARRAIDQHGKPGARGMAGEAVAIQHDVAMNVMKIVLPGLAVAERSVRRGPEISVT